MARAARGKGSPPLRVEILSTGDELARGRSRDTNYARIASLLTEKGFDAAGGRIVGDSLPDLLDALRRAVARADAVVVTGGLGPTADDLTREAAAALLRVPLVEDPASRRRIESLWRGRGVPMPPSNLRQALLPRGAAALRNDAGTAPGIAFRLRGTDVFCLPGPPREMEPMLARHVLPALRRRFAGRPRERTLYASCCGVPESDLADRLADLMARDRAVKVGTAVTEGIITVAVHGTGEAAREVGGVHREVLRRLGSDAYAPRRVGIGAHLVGLLRERGLTVALAESCTAGLVAARLADTPGASAVLRGGVVAYADALKESLLGVDRALLRRHGAVSGPVAEAMARGVRERTGADLAGAVTGVAGPGGGSRGKPVGTVWFAVADGEGVRSLRRRFHGDRAFVRSISVHAVLDLLRRRVEGVLPQRPV